VVDVWCTPIHGITEGPKVEGLAAAVKLMATVQRAGTITITGSLCMSPSDTLNTCAHTIPTNLLIEKWCFKAAIHLTTLPPEHPLFKLVKASANQKVIRHKSLLHNLMQIFQLAPNTISKIATAAHNPLDANKILLQISIANSKDESVIKATNAQEAIKVYSDGSENKGKVGMATILMKQGQQPHILHYHLGNDMEHTIQEAELMGILLRLHLIKTEKRGKTSFALGTDNQAAIKTLNTNLVQPGQHIALSFLNTATKLQKNSGTVKYSSTLRWTAGDVGTEGNKRADKEAKSAAAGTTSDKKLLPLLL